jgi:hypothetical protein
MNVCEALLHDAENCSFGRRGETTEVWREFQRYRYFAALCKPFYVQLDCRRQANFIKERRMKQMGHGAKILGHLLHQFRTVLAGLPGIGAKVVTFGCDRSQIHAQRSEKLPRTVV